MTLAPLDLDPRHPTPAMAQWHSQRLLRRARWQRLALPPSVRLRPSSPAPVPAAPSSAVAQIEQSRFAWNVGLRARGIVHVSTIIRVIAERYGVPADKIISRSRKGPTIRPRQIAMYVAWLAGRSLVQTGAEFDRHHATVLHAVRKIGREVAANPAFAADVRALFVACGGCEG